MTQNRNDTQKDIEKNMSSKDRTKVADGTWTGPGSDPGEGLDGTPRDSNRLLGLSDLGGFLGLKGVSSSVELCRKPLWARNFGQPEPTRHSLKSPKYPLIRDILRDLTLFGKCWCSTRGFFASEGGSRHRGFTIVLTKLHKMTPARNSCVTVAPCSVKKPLCS